MLYSFHDMPSRDNPKIRYAHKEFSNVDDPENIRWRAFWDASLEDGLPCGIELRCFPVMKKTDCAAWIDPTAFRVPDKILEGGNFMSWNCSDNKALWKLVYDRSSRAWAKRTQEEALNSLAIRLRRWSKIQKHAIKRINAACEVGEALLGGGLDKLKI